MVKRDLGRLDEVPSFPHEGFRRLAHPAVEEATRTLCRLGYTHDPSVYASLSFLIALVRRGDDLSQLNHLRPGHQAHELWNQTRAATWTLETADPRSREALYHALQLWALPRYLPE